MLPVGQPPLPPGAHPAPHGLPAQMNVNQGQAAHAAPVLLARLEQLRDEQIAIEQQLHLHHQTQLQ